VNGCLSPLIPKTLSFCYKIVPRKYQKLNGLFTQITFESPNKIIAGAGASDAEVARFAASKEIAGLEFLIGIPGTIGGGLRMNAGANGGEFKDVLERTFAIDRNGIQHWGWIIATPRHLKTGYSPMLNLSAGVLTSNQFVKK